MNQSKLEVITCSWRKARENACERVTIGHVRYINILAWLRGFRVKIANFSSFFCLSIPKRDLDTKKTTPNIEVWPESLGAMLEYWYIERGLLVLVLLLIGWKSGTNLLSQSRSVVNAKPITFRHSNENRSNSTIMTSVKEKWLLGNFVYETNNFALFEPDWVSTFCINEAWIWKTIPCTSLASYRYFQTKEFNMDVQACYSNLGAISAKGLLSTGLSSLIYNISHIRLLRISLY